MSKLNAVLARNASRVDPCICDFSHSVAFSHYNNFSAQLPVDYSGNLVEGGIKEQADQCFANIELITRSIKHTLDDVVRLTIFTKTMKDVDAVIEVMNKYFPVYKPTFTSVVVNELPLDALVQVEAVMTCGEGTIPNAPQAGDLIKLVRNTDKVYQNVYSNQTVAFSHYNHLSAILPYDVNGNVVSGGIKEQTIQCFKNIKTILESIDVPFDDIVKVNIYTTALKDEKKIKEVYKTFFPDSAIARTVNYLPALAIHEVNDLPKSAKIQVEVTVSHGDGTPPQLVEDRHGIVIKANNTGFAPINPYSSQTVAFSHYNNISEQFPCSQKSELVVSSDVNEQLKQCIRNLKYIVEGIDHKLSDVVKLNIYVKNIKDIKGFGPILKEFFKVMPAGRIIGVRNLGSEEIKVKIDAIVSNAEGTPPSK